MGDQSTSRGVERQSYETMGLVVNIGFYVAMLFYTIKSFYIYRKRGGIKGKDTKEVSGSIQKQDSKKEKDLEK